MELSLIEKTQHTRIKVPVNRLPAFKNLIASYIALYGGREIKRSSKFIYFEIDADLLSAGRSGENG